MMKVNYDYHWRGVGGECFIVWFIQWQSWSWIPPPPHRHVRQNNFTHIDASGSVARAQTHEQRPPPAWVESLFQNIFWVCPIEPHYIFYWNYPQKFQRYRSNFLVPETSLLYIKQTSLLHRRQAGGKGGNHLHPSSTLCRGGYYILNGTKMVS